MLAGGLHLMFRALGIATGITIVVLSPDAPSFAQTPSFRSADGKYEATVVHTGLRDRHYQIKDIKTGEIVFLSHSKYPSTPNDVKSGAFNPDSDKFVAAYHYRPDGRYPEGYTWIRIWDIKTRRPLRTEERPGYVDVDESIFAREPK